MSEHEKEDHFSAIEPEEFDKEEETAPVGSLLDQLAARRQEIVSEISKAFPLPGYNDKIWARYQLLDGKEIGRITTHVFKTTGKDDDRGLLIACRILAQACVEILTSVTGDETGLMSVAETLGEEAPVRYDSRLAKALGFEANTTVGVVMGVFGNRDLRVIGHAGDVQRWMGIDNRAALEELLGEE